jgi:hypothetical protein
MKATAGSLDGAKTKYTHNFGFPNILESNHLEDQVRWVSTKLDYRSEVEAKGKVIKL